MYAVTGIVTRHACDVTAAAFRLFIETRMVVVKLVTGGLLVYSPVKVRNVFSPVPNLLRAARPH